MPGDELVRVATECGRCGSCRAVCPVWRELGWESWSPRGKLALARRAVEEARRQSAVGPFGGRLTEVLSHCALCGACDRVCGTCLDLRGTWLSARRRFCPGMDAYRSIRDAVEGSGNVAGRPQGKRLDWAEDLPEGAETVRVATDLIYYVGCVTSYYPRAQQVALALVEVLQGAGVSVRCLGPEEYCCGFPLRAAGYHTEAENWRERNWVHLRSLAPCTVVTSCPTCLVSLGEGVLESPAAGTVGAVSRGQPSRDAGGVHLVHHSRLLARLVREGAITFSRATVRVTYHDPCDLLRHPGGFEDPREVLEAIPGLVLMEMEHRGPDAWCCGGGGNLQSVDPLLVRRIASRRVAEAVSTGADVLVTACPQCLQVLEEAARDSGSNLAVRDLAEVVREYRLPGGVAGS